MSIIKHTIPILEYDTNPYAVIDPTHEKLDLDLPKKCVFAFLGDYIDQFAIHHHAEKVAEFISATKKYPIYSGSVVKTKILDFYNELIWWIGNRV